MSIFELWALFVALPFIGNVGIAATVILSIICILLFVIIVITSIEDPDFRDKIVISIKEYRAVFYILASVVFIGGLVPNEKQIALIVGGSVVTNTDGISELPENIVNAANNYLKAIENKE